jgi:hypothetical protein
MSSPTTTVNTMSSDESDTDVSIAEARSPQGGRASWIRWGLAVLGLVLMMGAVLVVRGWHPWTSDSSSSNTMPTSAEIENEYGIRFTTVGITAGGGMIMLRYQVLDSDKTNVVHDKDTAPYVIGADGKKYADPGMQGHTHIGKASAAGTFDSVLLANGRGGVKPGDHVTIKIGKFELKNIPVV